MCADSEDRILHWVRCIVEEAYTVVDFEQSHDDQEITNLLDFTDPRNLSLAVLKIWAHFFKSNTQWLFMVPSPQMLPCLLLSKEERTDRSLV